jgi:protein-tyrosine phosphatase
LTIPDYTKEVIYRLKISGCTPIIAHPERNPMISENIDLAYDLIERGALMQLNSTSIRGVFGKKVKETSVKLLKRNLIHLISSDAHTTKNRAPRLSKAKLIMEEYIGKKNTAIIFENGEKVLSNERIEPFEMRKSERSLAFKFSKNMKRLVANIIG